MPTLKPRISITVDADDLAVLDRYSAASGTPRATILAGLVHAVVPELDRAAGLIELANAAPRHVVEGLVENLSNATADAMGFLKPFENDFHLVMDTLSNKLQGELPLDEPSSKRRKAVAEGAKAAGSEPPRPPTASKPGKRRKGPQDPHLLTGGSK